MMVVCVGIVRMRVTMFVAERVSHPLGDLRDALPCLSSRRFEIGRSRRHSTEDSAER